jgi:hypothetical protein
MTIFLGCAKRLTNEAVSNINFKKELQS